MPNTFQHHPRDPKNLELIARMHADPRVRAAWRQAYDVVTPYRYSYNWTWLGIPMIQLPQDVLALQEIIWRTQPEVIVETGIAHGGSLIFSASMLSLLGGAREVIGIDIDIHHDSRAAIEAHPVARLITMYEGSSIDPDIAAHVVARIRDRSTMVILDSSHTADHVANELRLYAPLVRNGFYCVALDTAIEFMEPSTIGDRPWHAGNSPLTAVRQFLTEQPRFVVDKEFDKLLFTEAPNGYLRATGDA